MFLKGNEYLSDRSISEEVPCLCAGFEKSNFRRLKSSAFDELEKNIESERKFDWYGLNVFDL